MSEHPPADWFEFWVRFVCGVLLGVGLGLAVCGEITPPGPHLWLVLPVGGVVFGLLAAWLGDPFWRTLLSWFGW